MSERTVFLVYGFDYYEYPYHPIKAFDSEARARALLSGIAAHQDAKPPYPGNDASDEEFDAWDKQMTRWRDGHPAGDASSFDGFAVMPLPMEDTDHA
jgi:hypothetical protein